MSAKQRFTLLDELDNGYRVSTADLGIFYETMVFPPNDMIEVDCDRYSPEEEAREGHAHMVEEWSAQGAPAEEAQ